MTYPKQVVLIIHHSEDERQIKRIIFKTMEDHMEYIKDLPDNQQLIEQEDKALDLALSWDDEEEPRSASQLLHDMFKDIGQSYKDLNPKN
tara:strand:+ start:582 stop:851 length:270 start_codon:yes stop_codon:yes gene_type:complete